MQNLIFTRISSCRIIYLAGPKNNPFYKYSQTSTPPYLFATPCHALPKRQQTKKNSTTFCIMLCAYNHNSLQICLRTLLHTWHGVTACTACIPVHSVYYLLAYIKPNLCFYNSSLLLEVLGKHIHSIWCQSQFKKSVQNNQWIWTLIFYYLNHLLTLSFFAVLCSSFWYLDIKVCLWC